MKLLVVNNHDSFTYNLVELVRQLNMPYQVVNVEVLTEDTPKDFSHILISPGPDVPSAYPQLFKLLQNTYREKSILGVCLGLQTLGQFFGAHLYNLATPRHGLQSQIKMLVKTRMWQALPEQFKVGLYHSWALSKEDFPTQLQIVAEDDAGVVMAFQHRELPIFAVQFHPESYMSQYGVELLRAWLFHT